MQTQRLILDSIKESDKEDYFLNISHDKKVLEPVCRDSDENGSGQLCRRDPAQAGGRTGRPMPGQRRGLAAIPVPQTGYDFCLDSGKTALRDLVKEILDCIA